MGPGIVQRRLPPARTSTSDSGSRVVPPLTVARSVASPASPGQQPTPSLTEALAADPLPVQGLAAAASDREVSTIGTASEPATTLQESGFTVFGHGIPGGSTTRTDPSPTPGPATPALPAAPAVQLVRPAVSRPPSTAPSATQPRVGGVPVAQRTVRPPVPIRRAPGSTATGSTATAQTSVTPAAAQLPWGGPTPPQGEPTSSVTHQEPVLTFDTPAPPPGGPVSLQGIFELARPESETGPTSSQPAFPQPAPSDPLPTEPVTIEQPADGSVDVQRAASPSPASPAATPGAAASHSDLEELARQLYDPLVARLRADLWLDRERAGLITGMR
jgi:hypothetical protein